MTKLKIVKPEELKDWAEEIFKKLGADLTVINGEPEDEYLARKEQKHLQKVERKLQLNLIKQMVTSLRKRKRLHQIKNNK